MLKALAALLLIVSWSQAQSLPDWPLNNLKSGPEVRLSEAKGQWLLVDFWASWCLPCRETFPAYQLLIAEHPALHIIGVSLDLDRDQALEFMEQHPVDFELLWAGDRHNDLMQHFELLGMPSAYLFNPDGELLKTYVGMASKDELAVDLLQWLSEPNN